MRTLLVMVFCAAPLMGQAMGQAMVQGTTPASATSVETGVVTGMQASQIQAPQAPTPGMQVPGTAAPGATPYRLISPVVMPTISPGQVELLELEARFAEDVAKGGGAAFATWFGDDAVALNNGKPAVLGRGAIATQANWDPKVYQLTWVPQGAQMGPSNDMGFTWGHYEGRTKDKQGNPVVTGGRYMTVWRKGPAGWKVAMDASAEDGAGAGECCALPK